LFFVVVVVVVVFVVVVVVVVVVVGVITRFLEFYFLVFEKDFVFWELDPFLSTGEMFGRHRLSWVQLGICQLTNAMAWSPT
jgi:hypothetical protein